MTPHPAAVPPVYLIGGLICLVLLLTFLIAGIIVAVRSTPGVVRGCAITTAAACSVLSCLALILLIGGLLASIISGSQKASEAKGQVTAPTRAGGNKRLDQRLVQAKDHSCQIFVPKPWLDAPDLNTEAVIGVKDPGEQKFAMVLTDTKEQYHGSLSDYAHDTTRRMRDKLTAPQMDAPETITINGRSAVRQILRGEYDHLKIVYVITYFESETRLYQLICWSLESEANSAKADFEKIAQFFKAE
jgi:hypothetical protein